MVLSIACNFCQLSSNLKKKSPLSKQTDRGRVIHQVGTLRSQTEFQLFLLLPFQFDAKLAHSSTTNLVAKNKVFELRRNGRKSSKHTVTIVNFCINLKLWFYSKWITKGACDNGANFFTS